MSTTKSIPALRAYDEGSQLARAGDNTQAVSKLEEATSARSQLCHGVFQAGADVRRARL